MENSIIKKQIIKFQLYGFLKNLKFFEPFLWVYFLSTGINYVQIGLLIAVKEIVIYVFEVPSGVFADRYGKKTELVICFIFYILSFIIFFFGRDFYVFMAAMLLFGLGEAFRSGTHKAMIMSYLDKNNVKESKSKIYGRTRSFSLIGSTVSSLIAIVFIFIFPSLSWLFLIAIIPYILDLLLILSYPNYLNERVDDTFSFKGFMIQNYKSIKYVFKDRKVLKLLIGSSSYNAGFKSIKDYIQPIILSVSLGVLIFSDLSLEENTTIYIGVIYSLLYIISAFASLNAYRFSNKYSIDKVMGIMWLLSGLSLIVLSIFISNIIVISIVFILIYVFLNIRKPLMIEKIGDATKDNKRASVLSIESQFTSLIIAFFAPMLGLIADLYSISLMLSIFGGLMIFIFMLRIFTTESEEILKSS